MSARKKKKHPVLRFFRNLFLFVLIVAVIGYGVTLFMIRQNFGRGDYPDKRYVTWYTYDDVAARLPREMVTFMSGENRLVGYIYGAENNKGLLVFAHGIGCGHEVYLAHIMEYVAQGWRVFAYDAAGSGDSAGTGTRSLTQSAIDLDAALRFAESDLRLAGIPVVLLGHSWGGYAVANVLLSAHRIDAVVSMSGYSDPVEELMVGTEGTIGEIPAKIVWPCCWLYDRLSDSAFEQRTAVEGINSSTVPILIIHGTEDETVPFDTASIISKRAQITNPNAEYMEIAGADHNHFLYSDAANEYREQVTERWKTVTKQYDSSVPQEVRDAFMQNIDKAKCNEQNADLIRAVDGFLTAHIPVRNAA